MTQPIEDLARRFNREGFPNFGEDLKALAVRAKAAGVPRAFTEDVSPVDLRKQTLEFLSANVFREPAEEEMAILSSRGYDTVLSADAKPLSLVVAENKDHFWDGELDYVNARAQLKEYVPPALTVALRSGELFLAGSLNQSQPVQLQMIETESQAVQELVPGARAIMLPASSEAQFDLSHFKKTGQVLFRDRFARALDETSDVHVAHVGRRHPDFLLFVNECDRDHGGPNVGVLSAVVFIQK